jgi:hypothetical protein
MEPFAISTRNGIDPVRFEQAEPGTEYVITRYRSASSNLRTQLTKIIKRAGLVPWPKLWQNLRATRETELAENWPMHVVCAWIGNSQAVAAKHYLQVTDEHFEQAAEAVHNPVQQPAATSCTGSQDENDSATKPFVYRGMREGATLCEISTTVKLGDDGLEPPTPSV